jgi:hypothetical protein
MNPLLLVAFGLFPDLVRLIAGDEAGTFAGRITNAVKDVTQTEDDKAAQKKLEADPVVKADLQKRLADIALEATKEQNRADEQKRQVELDVLKENIAEAAREREDALNRFREELKSTGDARTFYADMSKAGGAGAWINPTLSLVITIGFLFFVYRLMDPNLDLNENQVFNIALGAMSAAFATVIGFHFGSSVGSKDKDIVNKALVTEQAAKRIEERVSPPEAAPPPVLSDERPSGGSSGATFEMKAPHIARGLITDFGLTENQACGILGNIGLECDGFRQFQERGTKPPRGGWGWCQWTGPRRRAFEKYAMEHGLDFRSDAANYGFLSKELGSSEAAALAQLKRAKSLEESVKAFMQKFERPGVPNLAGRLLWANRALKAYREAFHG